MVSVVLSECVNGVKPVMKAGNRKCFGPCVLCGLSELPEVKSTWRRFRSASTNIDHETVLDVALVYSGALIEDYGSLNAGTLFRRRSL